MNRDLVSRRRRDHFPILGTAAGDNGRGEVGKVDVGDIVQFRRIDDASEHLGHGCGLHRLVNRPHTQPEPHHVEIHLPPDLAPSLVGLQEECLGHDEAALAICLDVEEIGLSPPTNANKVLLLGNLDFADRGEILHPIELGPEVEERVPFAALTVPRALVLVAVDEHEARFHLIWVFESGADHGDVYSVAYKGARCLRSAAVGAAAVVDEERWDRDADERRKRNLVVCEIVFHHEGRCLVVRPNIVPTAVTARAAPQSVSVSGSDETERTLCE
mmetsp:Transcript_31561/g.68252  ORF Transcript_31561/g.68252 Transcript_31561/m.68252 type:complete len:273 (-) Transcript_31561:121-939(-)